MRLAIELKFLGPLLLALVPTVVSCGDSGGEQAASADAGIAAVSCRSLLAANQTVGLDQEEGVRSF